MSPPPPHTHTHTHSTDRKQQSVSALWDFNQDTQTILRPSKPGIRNGVTPHHTNSTEQALSTTTTEELSEEDKAPTPDTTPTTTQLGIEETMMGKPDNERNSYVEDSESPVKRQRDSVISRQERPQVKGFV